MESMCNKKPKFVTEKYLNLNTKVGTEFDARCRFGFNQRHSATCVSEKNFKKISFYS